MFDIEKIIEPNTLDEALEILSINTDFKIIAGGTDILIKLHSNKLKFAKLISIRNIDELKGIYILNDETISIGANTTFSEVFRSEIINKYIPALSATAVSMGGPQIRNVATIGGNICNGAVSADSAPILFSLNAYLNLKSKKGERQVSILDFYEGPGKVKIEKDEILTAIFIKKEDYSNKKGKYIKFTNRKALDISMLGVAILYEVKENKFLDLRISLGVAAPTPIRCIEAEKYGIGKDITIDSINNIAILASEHSKPRDSFRGSKEYRLHLIKTLIIRILKESLIKEESD